MKKNFNIIQIKGIKGLVLVGFIATCLFVGFGIFPGWLLMNLWNCLTNYIQLPIIGLVQGALLWGIILVSYFTFRKEKLVVCMKSSEGLSEEELKKVFGDIKKQINDDKILQTMLKAKETELKIIESIKKDEENKNNNNQTIVENIEKQASEEIISK